MTNNQAVFLAIPYKGREVYVRELQLRARLEAGKVQKKAVGLLLGLLTSGEEVWNQFEQSYPYGGVTWTKVALAVKDVVEAAEAHEKPTTTRIEKLWLKLGLQTAVPNQMETEVDRASKILRVRWNRDFYLANKTRCYGIMQEMRQAAPKAGLMAWWAQGWLCLQPQSTAAK